MKVLCVAEKPSIAKEVTNILSGGRLLKRSSPSKYNFNFDFKFDFPGYGLCDVTMTSVIGHINQTDFPQQYGWGKIPPGRLFDVPIEVKMDKSKEAIHRNISKEARNSSYLMIWTDCDREGEAIGYEIFEAAKKGNPTITFEHIWRPHFSHLERNHILNAARNPKRLDMKIVDAVNCRQELDLRVGASFTRLLTDALRGQKNIPSPVSYGTCQFPALGFIVDRYKRVKGFKPEKFWYIDVEVTKQGVDKLFSWTKGHFFDKLYVVSLYQDCMKHNNGTITSVTKKPTSNYKPFPLTTVQMQKDCASYYKMSAKATLDAAEKLYTSGWISYPRTETDKFPHAMNLQNIIKTHTQDSRWGQFANNLIEGGGFSKPREGKNDDKSHPPIHPVKYTKLELITDANQKKVYEYVVRRFLACCSKDAEGFLTVANLKWGNEMFTGSGLEVTALNYLEIYTYKKWQSSQQLPPFVQGESIPLKSGQIKEGKTSPPKHMTETELIALMDANGIGTDATIADHIHRIEQRLYIEKVKLGGNQIILPTQLGIGLIEGFSCITFENNISLSKPLLRKRLEILLKDVEVGKITREAALKENVDLYKKAYVTTAANQSILINEYKKYQT